MPLPLTVSFFSKIQIGFTFLVPAHPGSPGQRDVKRVCVLVIFCQVTFKLTFAHHRAAGVENSEKLSLEFAAETDWLLRTNWVNSSQLLLTYAALPRRATTNASCLEPTAMECVGLPVPGSVLTVGQTRPVRVLALAVTILQTKLIGRAWSRSASRRLVTMDWDLCERQQNTRTGLCWLGAVNDHLFC